MRAAWFCPSCQKHHAPHCDTCPAPARYGLPGTLPGVPVWTPWQQPSTAGDRRPTWGGIGIGAACVGQANNSSGLQ